MFKFQEKEDKSCKSPSKYRETIVSQVPAKMEAEMTIHYEM